MNGTGSTMKKVAIAGAGAAGIGAAALIARKALLNAVVLPDNIFGGLNERGSLKKGVEKDLFKGTNLTDEFKSHSGISEGIAPESKVSKKSIIAEMVENPHIDGKFPAAKKADGEKDTITNSFLKNNGIANNID